MIKKFIFSSLALLLLINPSLILADNDNTIDYLESQSQNTWISQALASADVSDVDISYMNYQTEDLMTAIKNLLTLAALNSQDAVDLNFLVSVIENNKNNGQFGSVDLLNDDFWALMALASVNELSNVDDVKVFILDHQNDDGGWSWASSGLSDSNDTAAAIMALLDLGYNSSSPEIVVALTYLQNTQNNDGGFGYDIISDSDGASTAWIIAVLNKAGIDSNTWQNNNNTPTAFLESLRQDDGSFLWMPSDTNGSIMVTAYALVALTNHSYPINYITIPDTIEPITGHNLRIEGPNDTICLASNLEANTVLELLEVAAIICDFDYIVEDSAYGIYISSIGGIAGAGMEGWQYFVDWQSGMVAVTDYVLADKQEVLWFYGGFPLYPTKLSVDNNNLDINQSLTITTQYYDGSNWQTLPNIDLLVADSAYQTNNQGELILNMSVEGVYPIYSDYQNEYARSNKEYVSVGQGISQIVDLSVQIESSDGDGGSGNPNTLAFSIDQSSINFGSLKAGQSSETILNLSNAGNVNIYIEASIIGDNVFTDFTELNQAAWEDYQFTLDAKNSSSVNIGLSIPSQYTSFGQKDGQLIFWAISQ